VYILRKKLKGLNTYFKQDLLLKKKEQNTVISISDSEFGRIFPNYNNFPQQKI